ncbi:DUF192 domain-containing protein [Parvibium lacunae]|nr:DUF192 domain-containing protein [Parvibium lacunae]
MNLARVGSRWLFAVLSLLSAVVLAQPAQIPQPTLPQVTLTVGGRQIQAEMATENLQRQIGLMQRQHLGTHEGMIFIFPEKGQQCFWMRNTLLPLTAAFIDDDGTIVNLADMQPLKDDSHCSKKPVRYVLEMNQGWFRQQGVKAGQKVQGIPK